MVGHANLSPIKSIPSLSPVRLYSIIDQGNASKLLVKTQTDTYMNREGQFEVEIKARDNYKHYVCVRQPGDTVHWTFTTKKKNIGFGLFYLNNTNKDQEEGERPLTLSKSVSSESLALAKKNSQLLAKAPLEATLSNDHVREILRCAHPLVHISPPPKQSQSGLHRTGSFDGDTPTITGSTDSLSLEPSSNVDMIEIVAVERYSSAESTVTGSLDAPVAGTYVLLFDNTFSINTAKQLTLCVSVRRSGSDEQNSGAGGNLQHLSSQQSLPATIVNCGWMLKRKRLRMQGFSKRWFKLDSTGLLTYHDDPDGPVKGGLNVRMCVITKTPLRCLFTLDSGTELFHLKALTDSDYHQWSDRINQVIQYFIESDHRHHQQPSEQPYCQDNTRLLKSRIAEHRSQCSSAMEELKESGECEQDAVVAKYLGRLEKTFASLNALYSELIELEKALTMATPIQSKALPAASQQPTIEEDVFYDVVIMSDVSDEELLEMDRSLVDHLAGLPSTEPSIAPSLDEVEQELVQQQLAAGAQLVRLSLPARAAPVTISYTQLIGHMSKRNATTPVVLNEPLSMLQRQCEELEYCDLLLSACKCESAVDRIAYVAAFAVSCYAQCQYRYEYKPFTPMLGETFEWFDVVRGFRFVAEKVEHRPEMILACHGESLDNSWVFWQELQVKTKTWGKTAEMTPGGLTHVRIKTPNGQSYEYRWNKVTTCVRNMLSKDIFIDNFGEMVITCVEDDACYAKLEFMKSATDGLWGSLSTATRTGRNEICGSIIQNRRVASRLSGRWDDYLALEERVLWKAIPPPSNCRDYYGFSLFALQLNVPVAITDGDARPAPTDSRFRPDQRLLEEGDLEEAGMEKGRVEQRQRAERSAREERGEEYRALWFERGLDAAEYEFMGKYFVEREAGFKDINFPQLW